MGRGYNDQLLFSPVHHGLLATQWPDDYLTKNEIDAVRQQAATTRSDSAVVISQIGWHMNWMMVLKREDSRLAAYETLAAEIHGDCKECFGRGGIPEVILRAAEKCGIEFAGTWRGDADILRLPRSEQRTEGELDPDDIPLPKLLVPD